MPEQHDRREDVIVAFRKWLRNDRSSAWSKLSVGERELLLNHQTKKFAGKLPEAVTVGKTVKNKIKEKIGRW